MNMLLINPPVLAVDPYQVYAYADVPPYGLYQMATLLQDQGHQVRLLDMMEYLEGNYAQVLVPANLFGTKACGDADTLGASRQVYRLGRSGEWLDERLGEEPAPDQVLVTCCLGFNWEPAHEVIRTCRAAFPKARIRLGGFYPSAFPEHAAASGADEVYQGRWEEVEETLPRLDLCSRTPRNWLFRLVSGCRYRCSFCYNSASPPRLVCDPEKAAIEVRRLRREYGIEEFSNWDPNILQQPEVLTAFLDRLTTGAPPVGLRFDMGISPNLLTAELAERMLEAGTLAMTIPFESVDSGMMQRFGKPYRVDDSLRALDICRKVGFDVSRFHCTFLLGVRGEDPADVLQTYLTILAAGGKPTPFPLTPTPGTREYELHREFLRDKDLDLLNGHLWPTQGQAQGVELYERLLRVVSCLDLESARAEAVGLPAELGEHFERQAARLFGLPAAGPAPVEVNRPCFTLPGWLHALCQGCVDLASCSAAETRREPDPQRCYQERRGVDLEPLASLMADLRRHAGLDGNERLATHEQRMWRHLEDLQTRCANTFEPSLSWDGRRWHAYRYTYSFHDDDPGRWAADAGELLDWVELLDSRARPHAEALLKITAPPLARGLLFGQDARPDGRTRLKIYFRFHAGLPAAKRRLLAGLTGGALPTAEGFEPERLFLVGFDLGPRGVAAVKYYFLHERMATASFAARFPAGSAYPALVSNKAPADWQEVILIARQAAALRDRSPEPLDANVHCLHNDIGLEDVRRALAGLAGTPDLTEVDRLFARHPLFLSSITFPLVGGAKANLYYRLAG